MEDSDSLDNKHKNLKPARKNSRMHNSQGIDDLEVMVSLTLSDSEYDEDQRSKPRLYDI